MILILKMVKINKTLKKKQAEEVALKKKLLDSMKLSIAEDSDSEEEMEEAEAGSDDSGAEDQENSEEESVGDGVAYEESDEDEGVVDKSLYEESDEEEEGMLNL